MRKYLSFLKGIGSIIDIFGTSFHQDTKEIKIGSLEDDAKALKGDFDKAIEKIKKGIDNV